MKIIALLVFLAVPLSAQMHQRFPASADVSLTTQAASIATSNAVSSAPTGIYNVCWVQQITQAATVSSSLVVTIGWNNGSAKTTTLFSLNGALLQITADATNALNSTGSNCVMIFSAASQAITYATTYVSAGATPMQYSLFMTVERYQ